MTPKEKANELVVKYRRFLPINLVTMLEVKGCALIAVDEVLSNMDEEDNDVMYKYWKQVKKEIEKL
jgi:hypothetical protein